MKASYIFANMENHTEYIFQGSRDEEIFEIQLLTEPITPDNLIAGEGILYFSDLLNKDILKDSPACILFLPLTKIYESFQRTEKLLSQDYRRNAALAKVHAALAANFPPSKLVEICHKVMQNPVWFVDRNFEVISYSVPGKRRILFPEALKRKANGIIDLPIFIEPNENFPTRQLMTTLSKNDIVYGYILVFELENRFFEPVDLDYMTQLSNMLNRYFNTNYLLQHSSPTEQFILNILSGQITDSTSIHQQFENLQMPHYEQYYLLAIDQGISHSLIHVKEILHKILMQEVYEYEHYYISLIGCKTDTALSFESYPDLVKYLKEYKLYAGLSNAFFDIAHLNQAYQQCQLAISLRKRYSNSTYFARYEDLILTHLLDIANSNGISVLSFCHPSVTLIYEYDKAHDTEYLKTLTAYVFNFCNLQQTAEALFIHRNTAYHRINNLKEMFNLDFDNPRLLMKLRISATVYNYLGYIDTANLWGPMI